MVKQIAIQGFDDNFSYFVVADDRQSIAVVDPGDLPRLNEEITEHMYRPQMILVTHSHFDHVSGVAGLVNKFGIPVYVHKHARGKLEVEDDMCVYVEDGDVLHLDDVKIEVWHTPGHIEDAVCYLIDDGEKALITGDTLFVEGCGRADFPESNVEDLWHSLQRIKQLPDEIKIYPGHNYGSKAVSDLAWEKAHNKYLRCKSFEEFQALRLPQG